MTFAVDRLDHVEVFVRDIPTAARWYAETLGLTELIRWDPEPVMIGAGGTMLALFRAPAAGIEPRAADGVPALWHRVAWRTDRAGFAAAQERLLAHGILFEGPIDHKKSWSIYFDDLDGHHLEITYYV